MSIRLRLALLYATVLAISLLLANLLIYGLMVRHFQETADESAASHALHVASTIQVSPGAGLGYHNLLLPPIDAFAAPGVYVQVLGVDGELIARSSNLDADLPIPAEALLATEVGQASYVTTWLGRDLVRVYTLPLLVGGRQFGLVQVARSNREDENTLGSLRLAMLGAGLVALVGTGLVSWAVAGRALQPVSTLTHTARAIALSRSLARRVTNTESQDELGELARTFNEMLGSLEEAYQTQQRFVADASHELRTPLTIVQGNLDLLRAKSGDLPREELALLATAAGAETSRMAKLVSDLLMLARADAGQSIVVRPVELDRVLLDVFQQARVLAGDVSLKIAALDQLAVLGDPDRLKQLLLVLVDNALKYTPAGGEVALELRREGDWALVEVKDTGIGIAARDLPRIFERFYRADKARSRDLGGTGLGLAIARWIAEEHGGEILVKSASGKGSTFTVRLPLAARAGEMSGALKPGL